IRGASGDLPQGWGFKCAEFFGVTGHHIATKIHFVVIPADADVVKLFIGEVESGMAFRASCLIPEQKEALLGRFWNCSCFLSLIEPVCRAVAGKDGTLEAGNGLAHPLRRDVLIAENLLEEFPIACDFHHLRIHHIVVGEAVLDRIRKRTDRLGFQCWSPAVPKLSAAEDPVEGCRRATTALLASDARGDWLAVRKGVC